MKEHFDDYEERIRNFLEEGEEEMDAALGEMFDPDAVEFPETLDEKIYTKIRGVNERMDANSTGENGDCEETEGSSDSGMPNGNTVAATMPDENTVATTTPDENAVAATMPNENAVAATMSDGNTVAATMPNGNTAAATMPDENAVAATMSDEDAEALRLGKELQERRKAEDAKRAARRKFAPWKRAAAAVLAVAVIGCIGVQSQGGAEKVVEKLTGKHGFREEERVTSSKDEVKLDEARTEEQAYEQIREELGIEPVRVSVTDRHMRYLSCEVDRDLRTANIFYDYDGMIFSFIINCTYTEDVWGISYEEDKVGGYIYHARKADIQVDQYKIPETGEEHMVAEFEYQGMYYSLSGCLSQGEMTKILENLFFP